MYSTTAIMSTTQVGASTTNTTVDSLSQDTQVRLPLVLGDEGNELGTSQYRNVMSDEKDGGWTEEEDDVIHRNTVTTSKDVGTDTLRGVDGIAAPHQGHHDVDQEDGAGLRCSNPISDPSSLDTWRYPVHSSRTGLEDCTPTAAYTSSQTRITWVNKQQKNQELQREPRTDSICYDPRTATVFNLCHVNLYVLLPLLLPNPRNYTNAVPKLRDTAAFL